MEFSLIRSKRRTLALQVRPDGTLIVRARHSVREPAIHAFIHKNGEWIERTARRMRERAEHLPRVTLSRKELAAHKQRAFFELTGSCRYYSDKMGVRYQDLRLSNARGRWGSCSASGRLRFNWRLSLVPADVLDYVVVHELTHLKELNHSSRFWGEVEQWLPDYRVSKKWLKENAALLYI